MCPVMYLMLFNFNNTAFSWFMFYGLFLDLLIPFHSCRNVSDIACTDKKYNQHIKILKMALIIYALLKM